MILEQMLRNVKVSTWVWRHKCKMFVKINKTHMEIKLQYFFWTITLLWLWKKKWLISFCWVNIDNLKRKPPPGYNMLFFTLLSYTFFNWSLILCKKTIWYHLKCTCSRVLRYQIHIRMFWLYLFASVTSIAS